MPSVQHGQALPPPIEIYTHDLDPKLRRVRYRVHNNTSRSSRGALVDRGANGGIIGSDARIIHTHVDRKVDVTGIDNHKLSRLKVVDAVAVCESHKGPVLLVMRQCAYHGVNRTIHASGQMEWNQNVVHEKSMIVGGQQCLIKIGRAHV